MTRRLVNKIFVETESREDQKEQLEAISYVSDELRIVYYLKLLNLQRQTIGYM